MARRSLVAFCGATSKAAAAIVTTVLTVSAAAQVKHVQNPRPGGIADAVWVGDTLYVSGQMGSPKTPADREKGTPAVWGTTTEQAESAFTKIRDLLKEQGLGM